MVKLADDVIDSRNEKNRKEKFADDSRTVHNISLTIKIVPCQNL